MYCCVIQEYILYVEHFWKLTSGQIRLRLKISLIFVIVRGMVREWEVFTEHQILCVCVLKHNNYYNNNNNSAPYSSHIEAATRGAIREANPVLPALCLQSRHANCYGTTRVKMN